MLSTEAGEPSYWRRVDELGWIEPERGDRLARVVDADRDPVHERGRKRHDLGVLPAVCLELITTGPDLPWETLDDVRRERIKIEQAQIRETAAELVRAQVGDEYYAAYEKWRTEWKQAHAIP
jgi:hypothetical protein